MGDVITYKLWNDPLVTTLMPLEHFWEAEAYHQNYFVQHPGQGYCQLVIAPKVAKFRSAYPHLLK